MGKDFQRVDRVADVIQREIAIIIQQEIHDQELGMVTISVVKVSKDLKYAKVYFTSLSEAISHKEMEKRLNQAEGQLRFILAKRIVLRRVPNLHFVYDESLANGNRLTNLINRAIKDDEAK